jgi:Fic family protein
VGAAYRSREAVSSLAIEGTQTSLSEVLSAEAAESGERSEVREVLNYIRAFDHGLERLRELPLSLRLIRELHERLLRGVRGQERTPGEFRTSQNWIGRQGGGIEDATFVPPPPDSMVEALNDWERYLHEKPQQPALVRCALIHYQFETIHPFLDGNGRIGRLLIPFYLVEREILTEPLVYVSPYFETRRDDYYGKLQAVRQGGRFDDWVRFFLEAVEAQALDAVTRGEALLALVREFRNRLRALRVRGSALQLVEQLLANPFVTTSRAAEFLSVTPQGAAYVIGQLRRAGIVEETDRRGATRVYVARRILDLLEAS